MDEGDRGGGIDNFRKIKIISWKKYDFEKKSDVLPITHTIFEPQLPKKSLKRV